MKLGILFTDYKIRSARVYRLTILTFSVFLLAMLLAEIFIDLRSTNLQLLIPFTLAVAILTGLSFFYPDSRAIRFFLILITFLMMEIHFIVEPTSYHAIVWWFPFVPMIALIISGTKASIGWTIVVMLTFISDSIYLQGFVGDSYGVEVFRKPYLASSLIFTMCIMANSLILYYLLGKAYSKVSTKNTHLEKIKKRVVYKRNLLGRYVRQFISFSKDNANFNKGQAHLFHTICQTTFETLKVNRVSIWILEDNQNSLVRKYLYEDHEGTDEIVELKIDDYPQYFKALKTKPFIMATDSKTHEDTKEFADSYLAPLDIYSMLDCPILIDRETIGVICCENKGSVKSWNIEDTLFIQAFADFISMSYKNLQIKDLVETLKQRNAALKDRNRETEILNAALDERVQESTYELNEKSAQITEFSFINSHLMRAPLTRIMGLSEALAGKVKLPEDKLLLEALTDSSKELDLILRKINDVLFEGKGLTRKDLSNIEDDLRSKGYG